MTRRSPTRIPTSRLILLALLSGGTVFQTGCQFSSEFVQAVAVVLQTGAEMITSQSESETTSTTSTTSTSTTDDEDLDEIASTDSLPPASGTTSPIDEVDLDEVASTEVIDDLPGTLPGVGGTGLEDEEVTQASSTEETHQDGSGYGSSTRITRRSSSSVVVPLPGPLPGLIKI